LLAGIVGEAESVVCGGDSENNRARSLPLHTIHLQLTNKCNYRCSYCYATSGVQAHPMLPLELLKSVVDDAMSLAPHINCEMSGGEPLLYPSVFDLAQYVKSKGNSIYLLTNGSLVNEKNYRQIAE